MSEEKVPCNLNVPKPCQRPCGQPCGQQAECDEVDPCKQFWHPGFDARFPNMNQTRRCWQNYVDYIRCHEVLGEDHEPCEYFKKTYKYLCPKFWVKIYLRLQINSYPTEGPFNIVQARKWKLQYGNFHVSIICFFMCVFFSGPNMSELKLWPQNRFYLF